MILTCSFGDLLTFKIYVSKVNAIVSDGVGSSYQKDSLFWIFLGYVSLYWLFGSIPIAISVLCRVALHFHTLLNFSSQLQLGLAADVPWKLNWCVLLGGLWRLKLVRRLRDYRF